MRRYLIVANQTLGGDHLLEEVRERVAAGRSEFFVLVPAAFPHDGASHTEGAARATAQHRLDAALAQLRAEGVTVDGAVGDHVPLYAIEDRLRQDRFDEIILSTLPSGPSRWLRQDLPHRLRRATRIPVTHIVAREEAGIGSTR
jgi:GABA permease